MATDIATLDDLAAFARLELGANDIEPWAAVLRGALGAGLLDREGAAWAVKLYNAFDDISSAWQMMAHLGSAPFVANIATMLGLHVTQEAVRLWASRHKIAVAHYGPPRTPGGQPVPLYRVGDVLTLVIARDVARPA